MQLRYGAYLFPRNSVRIAIDKTTVLGPSGEPTAQKLRWVVSGEFVGTSPGTTGPLNLSRAISAMDANLQVPYRDLVFATDGGAPCLSLRNQGSSSGVVITSVSLPEDRNAYATYAPFSFTAEAEYPLVGTSPDAPRYTAWSETVETSGGLPGVVWRPALNASLQRQVVTPQATPFTLRQSGSATALWRPPVANLPILAGAVDMVERTISESASGNQFTVNWSYTYESARPMRLRPRAVPR